MPHQAYDVIVIGARVGGAIVAALLGDAGHRVLLVDRGSLPAPTASTHYFRGPGMVAVLERLGVLDEVLALGCPRLRFRYDYAQGSRRYDRSPTDGGAGFCLSVRREPLDDLLVRRARRSPTVDVAFGTRLEALLREGDRVVGARLIGSTGLREARARCVVGADGRRSTVARLVRAPLELGEGPARGLYYAYVRGFDGVAGPPDGAEFSMLGNELAYVFPSDGDVTCLALSVPMAEFRRHQGRAAEHFRERLEAHEGLVDRFRAAERTGRFHACAPTDNYVRVPWGPGWALVGDAGLHQDPWSGQGMDNGSTHATLLADALAGLLAGDAPEAEALAGYHARRNGHALEGYQRTVTLARDLTKR